ncbi:CMRF35-like molecule 2 [Octodon degus]|uniref:CMRF35-like molecule 2 n=1 Tax=Octodon degus TaxID=10160 RepID=A0A6P3VAE2_OCTDE|nr:CMRF35-like molecule 2 [Octodon degus]
MEANQSPYLGFTLCFPGCLSLKGPGYVNGVEGTTLSVKCRYDQGYRGYAKYWCQGEDDINCKSIVGTDGGERVRWNGRVSIKDHTDDFTMTVTIYDLRQYDAGIYWCKIQTVFIWDSWSRDPSEQVKVYVTKATTTTPLPLTTPILPLVLTGQNISTEMSTLYSWSLLSSLHFLLLVFLKLPLFLSMLCAVFWVNRPQRAVGEP